MFFSSLELIGFKSFKRTKFIFPSPICVFTGPNGCGKTNLGDAIRWVMGEQNLYKLRVKSISELIFHGADGEKPMGMAEVSILLNNNNNILPIVCEEVKITRRVLEGGESIYMINGKECKRKDITLLLLETGLSHDGYFLMNQEKIDAILKSSEERLKLFEEASTILPYKAKKEEALENIRKTNENITRIEDIIGELKKGAESLKYKASKARRYKRLKDELNVYKYHSLRDEYNKKNEELKKLRENEEIIKGEITKIEKINEEKMEDFKALKEALKEKEEKLFEIAKRKEMLKEEIAREEERIINLMEAISKIKEKESELLKKEKSLKDELLSIEKEKADLLKALQKDVKLPNISKTSSIIKEMLKEEEKIKDELIDRLSIKERIKGNLNEAERESLAVKARIERLKGENEKSSREMAKIDLKIQAIENEKQGIKKEIEKQKTLIYELNKKWEEILKEEKIAREIKAKMELVGKKLYGILLQEKESERLISDIKKLNLEGLIILKIQGMSPSSIESLPFGLLIVKNMEDALRLSKEGWKIVTIDCEALDDKTGEKNPNRLKEIGEKKMAIEKEKDTLFKMLLKNEEALKKASYEEEKEKGLKKAISLRIARVEDEIMLYKIQGEELQKSIGAFRQEVEKEEEGIKIVQIRLSDIKASIKALRDKEREEEEERRRIITARQLEMERLKFLEDKEKHQATYISNLSSEREAIIKEGEEKEKELIAIKKNLLKNKEMLQAILAEEAEIIKLKSSISSSIMEGEKIYFKEKERLNSLYKRYEENRGKIKEIEISLSFLCEKIKIIEDEYSEKIREIPPRLDKERAEKIEKELLKYNEIELSSIVEYDKIMERIAFYEKELSDLNKAKDDLLEAISYFDKKAKELFMETFEKVRENFSSLFLKVLQGGSADIVLNNGRIEIEAQMPGKKKKGLFLLSSGERTLLSILILFSLFMVKPAPFCFLDEADASLDDCNVKRFIELIKWFSKDTQFLIISHNKKTIEIGDTIYGITMETPGVSKFLSLRLKK